MLRAGEESLEADSFRDEDFKGEFMDDPGTCAFFGSRRPSGDQDAASRGAEDLGEAHPVWLEESQELAGLLDVSELSESEDDLKKLREEIQRRAASANPPARELFTTQVRYYTPRARDIPCCGHRTPLIGSVAVISADNSVHHVVTNAAFTRPWVAPERNQG